MSSTLLLIVVVFCGLITASVPFLHTKGTVFGVTIPSNRFNEPEVRKSKRIFFQSVVFLTLILTIMVFLVNTLVTINETTLSWLIVLTMTFQLLVPGVLYVYFNYQLQQKKKVWVKRGDTTSAIKKVTLDFRKSPITIPTSYIVLTQVMIVAVALILTVKNYQKIPNEIVMQWNFDMTPSRVVEKSWRTVLSLPLTQLFMVILFAISNRSLLKGKQRISSEVDATVSRQTRKISSLFLFFIGNVVQLIMLSTQLTVLTLLDVSILEKMIFIMLLLLLLSIIWLMLLYRKQDKKRGSDEYFDDDQYWKLGSIYWNKEDPSVWVEKRQGIGMTLNFANSMSWLFILGLVVFVAFVIIMTS